MTGYKWEGLWKEERGMRKGLFHLPRGVPEQPSSLLIAVSFLCIHSPESVNFIYFGKEEDN